jgi:hypothetical protein
MKIAQAEFDRVFGDWNVRRLRYFAHFGLYDSDFKKFLPQKNVDVNDLFLVSSIFALLKEKINRNTPKEIGISLSNRIIMT